MVSSPLTHFTRSSTRVEEEGYATCEEAVSAAQELLDDADTISTRLAHEKAVYIVSDGRFSRLVATMSRLKSEYKKYNKAFCTASRNIDLIVETGATIPCFDPEDTYQYAQSARALWRDYETVREAFRHVNYRIGAYLDEGARRADYCKITELRPGTPVGSLVSTGRYASGSLEWLRHRQNHIGASDMGAFVGSGLLRQSMYQRVWESKVSPIVESQESSHDAYPHDALSLGNACEYSIGMMFALRYPEFRVMHSKDTYHRDNSVVAVNFDFLLSSTGTIEPDGVLEIKTSSNPEEWKDESCGIDGIPKHYRAQVLTQCRQAGFSYGALAVLINGYDFRVYHFTMNDALRREADEYYRLAADMWQKITEAQNTGSTEPPNCVSYEVKRGVDAATEKSIMKEATWIARAQCRQTADVAEAALEAANSADVLTAQAKDRKKYSGHTYMGIDIECTGTAPTKSDIIEIGIAELAEDGTVTKRMSQLYGIDEGDMRRNGTGAVHVHHISAADIADKPHFSEPDNCRTIMDILTTADVVWAHYSTYEKRMLRAHLPGFAEAEVNGNIVVSDTRDIIRVGVEDAQGNTLQDFVESQGMEYRDAHRAYNDTAMMLEALHRWRARSA